MNNPIICADAIAKLNDTETFVLIERLNNNKGFALVGGKQDSGESLSQTIVREFKEETNLDLSIQETFGVYADLDRDPRGHYVSCIFVGTCSGIPVEEPEKIKIVFMTQDEIISNIKKFSFDHGKILIDYFALKTQ